MDRESIRKYQRLELGRRDGETALIELFPLPSPSTDDWIYKQCGVPEIADRDAYRAFLGDLRTSNIRERIRRHKPHAVVFYGRAYRDYWERIAATSFAAVEGTRFEKARLDSSLLVLAPHPVSKGVARADFCAIGEFIRS